MEKYSELAKGDEVRVIKHEDTDVINPIVGNGRIIIQTGNEIDELKVIGMESSFDFSLDVLFR